MASTVLIIDDEEVIRFAFQAHLEKAGYAVLTAANFRTAVEIIASNEPDVVIADIILENNSGIDVLKEIKRMEQTCPVIMITGEPNTQTAIEAVRLGAFDYLPKPVRKEELLNITRLALQHKIVVDEKESYRHNLEAIFGSMSDAVVTVDNGMRVLAANDAVKKIFGISPKEILGKSLSDIAIPCCRLCCQVLEQTLITRTPVREYQAESKIDGDIHLALVLNTSMLIHSGNRHRGAVLVARNITRITYLERELNERHRFHNMIGKSQTMQKIYNLMQDLADTESSVLITGESGVGKDLGARALHYEGRRSDNPFVVVNCSAFAEGFLESELFGHVRGAFTGALNDKIGRFQLAEGGTIFLDEIGDITPLIQLKLLRVLQEKVIEKVGDISAIPVDVRIITATHRNLKRMVATGEFRKDLYYRIKVIEINIPPLRKRYEDIPLLVEHLCKKLCRKMNIPIMGSHMIAKEVMDSFMRHSWPGNVRELENTLEHALVLCHGKTITMDHLPPDFSLHVKKELYGSKLSVHGNAQDVTKKTIIQALDKTDWNKAKAARILGVSRRTIYRKINLLKITYPTQ